MPLRFLMTLLFLSSFSFNTFAAACLDVFPDPSPDVVATDAEALDIPTFPSFTGNNNNPSGGNITLSEGEYDNVNVNSSVSFSTTGGEYYIKSLNINNGTVNMVAGDYYIQTLNMSSGSAIELSGEGTVRIYLQNTTSLKGDINASPVDDSYLIFVAYNSLSLDNPLVFNGSLYVEGNISINANSAITVKGSVTADNLQNFNGESNYSFEYTEEYISSPEFLEMCDQESEPELDIHFEFDEGSGQDAFDSSDNARDGVLGSNNSEVEDKDPSWQCAVDGFYLSFNEEDEERIEVDSFTPPSETTVAFWFKIPSTSNSVQRIFGFGDGWEARWDNNQYLYFDINKTGSNSNVRTSSPLTTTDTWMHIAFTGSVTEGTWAVYIDGELDNSGTESFAAQNASELYIGGSSWKSNEFFTGSLDNFRLYDGVLSSSEIAALAQDSPVDSDCAVAGELVAYYAFEQDDFDDEITDSSGNDYQASNEGGESTEEGKYCRGFFTDGQNTSSSTDNAFETSVNINDDIGLNGTISFWYQNEQRWGSQERMLFDATSSSDDKYFFLYIDGDRSSRGRLLFKFENEDDDDFTIAEPTPSSRRSQDQWYYVTVTWNLDDDIFQIYVDGELVIERSEDDDGSDYDTDRSLGELGSLVFGDNANSRYNIGPTRSARGYFDEVRIYSEVRTQSEIQADMNDNACEEGVIDHYEIHHNLTGLTCEPLDITVKACTSNDSGSSCTESTEAVSLTLGASQTDTVTKTVNFTGSTDTNIKYTRAETATLSVSDTTPSAANSTLCFEDGTDTASNCDVTFAETGFRFLSGASTSLPTQLSGKPSNVGYNSSTWALQAVKDDGTGVCEGALVDDITVNIKAVCTDPSSCAGEQVSINDEDILTEGASSSTTSYTPVTLDFGDDSQSTAEITFSYPDAGQMKLQAQYEIPADDDSTGGSTQYMTGESNGFVVKPFGFYIDNIVEAANTSNASEIDSEDATEAKFISAGTEFTLDITAKQWQSGNDSNSNGIHDDDDNISGNNKTLNFNDVITLTHTLMAPSVDDGANEGTLTVTNNQDSAGRFSSGVATLTATYSEVGIIELLVNDDGEYLDNVTDITGSEPYVGRFVADYFAQTLEYAGDLIANHNNTCTSETWAYAGQEKTDGTGVLNYASGGEPEILITAYNSDGEITTNYTFGDFMKLTAENVHDGLISPSTDFEQLRVGEVTAGEKVIITSDMNVGELEVATDTNDENVNGVMIYTYSDADNFIYEHNENSLLSPFNAQIPFEIRTDSNDGDLIADSDEVTLGASNATDDFEVLGVEIRFGRWLIDNAYGPETSSLFVPMWVQYYDETSTAFVINTDDTCTIPELEDKQTSGALYDDLDPWQYRLVDKGDDIDVDDTTASLDITGDTLDSGAYRGFIFSAANNQGSLDFEYEVPSWFKYNWLGDSDDGGEYIDNPTGIITFGRYRGNDRIISWQEIEN